MRKSTGFHENYDRGGDVRGGSNRQLGLVFAAVLAVAGLWPLLGEPPGVRPWALAASAAFVLVAVTVPVVLAPLNVLWTRLGILLSRIIQPVVLGLVFFVVVTPMAIVMRLAGKDPLRRRRERDAETYWIRRDPPGPDPGTMPDQF